MFELSVWRLVEMMELHCSLENFATEAGVCEGGTNMTMYELTVDEKELLAFRTKHKVTHLCEGHRHKYLKRYIGNQHSCCDPLELHLGQSRAHSLRVITITLARKNASIDLIPGKKLGTTCRKQIMLLPDDEKIEEEFEHTGVESDEDPEEVGEEELRLNVSALNDTLLGQTAHGAR